MLFAEIILPLALPRTLTYGVPEELQTKIKPGQRVEVGFGKNKLYSGLVFELHQNKPNSYQVKSIKKILDKHPIVSSLQLQFWNWIAQYYCCTLGDVMQAALPAHLKLMNDSILVWNNQVLKIPTQELSDEGFLLAEALQIRKQLTVDEMRQIAGEKNHAAAIRELLDLDLAFIQDSLTEKYKPKFEDYLTFTREYLDDDEKLAPVFDHLKSAPKQSELLLHFIQLNQKDEVSKSELLKQARSSHAQLNALIKKGILEIYRKEVSRLASSPTRQLEAPKFELNKEQTEAWHQIHQLWEQEEKEVVLLHGVTGSGKTMLYIRLIEESIQKDEQCLYLLPEIALTTQLVQRLNAHFGEQLGVYHSRFSNNERVEIWNKVRDGSYKVVIGARSALWLPFKKLSRIIIDEEHETSYKQQDPAPRYQARDAAIVLASLHKAKVLLGSATPSMESAYNVQKGKYGLVSLKQRFQNQAMPDVKVLSAGNIRPSLSTILTLSLLEAIQANMKEGKQCLLFQNKRGYAPFLLCRSCGFVPHCPNCDVSLTYHKQSDKLHCHYCGYKTNPIQTCPQCGQNKMVARSFGTEKIEEELSRIFPKRKIARMDTDSVRGKNRMAQLIRDFERGRIDILVGTQMIVKGLDFDNVGLVGILNADSLWSYPDFRINERAFQLMEQVSGRSGRAAGRQGQVIIQAYNLKHPLLEMVIQHDYKAFYRQEIAYRQQFGYPPLIRLIKLTLKHQKQEKILKAADDLAQRLRAIEGFEVQGPMIPTIPRVRNKYRLEILLKFAPSKGSTRGLKNKLLHQINETAGQRGNSGIQFIIDVDPG